MGFYDVSDALVILLAFQWCLKLILKTISFFALQNFSSLSFYRRLAFREHHNSVHTAERVIHMRWK